MICGVVYWFQHKGGLKMEYYLRYEIFRNGRPEGKGTNVFEATGIRDALVQASKMLEQLPTQDTLSGVEERVTVGTVVIHVDPLRAA